MVRRTISTARRCGTPCPTRSTAPLSTLIERITGITPIHVDPNLNGDGLREAPVGSLPLTPPAKPKRPAKATSP